jgi:hypothetical protein
VQRFHILGSQNHLLPIFSAVRRMLPVTCIYQQMRCSMTGVRVSKPLKLQTGATSPQSGLREQYHAHLLWGAQNAAPAMQLPSEAIYHVKCWYFEKAETVNWINESITKCCRNICCALPRAHGVLPLPGNYQTKGDSVTCADVSTQLKLLTGATST